MRICLLSLLLLALAACSEGGFVPNPKTVSLDADSGALIMPHPCPDWSAPADANRLNTVHSNFGCAVNRNSALQLADPNDLVRGHGDNRPDTITTTRVVERYRAGELPAPLSPIQSTSSSSSGAAAPQ